jgi:hypothetical protein
MLDFAQLSKEDDTDYQFIFEELCRFVNLDLGDLKKHYQAHPEDRLHNVPRPNGGNLLISQAGTERFSQIAKRGLEAMGSEGKKHNIQEIVKFLKKEFVGRLLTSPETITEENAHDIFDFVIKELSGKFEELDHFVPCSLVAHKIPRHFSIGPVRFVLKEDFFKQHDSELQAEDKVRFSWLQEFFSQFMWVASVRVPASDTAISTLRAHTVIQNALDLIIGFPRAARVRQGYSLGGPEYSAQLRRDSQRFLIGWNSRMQDAVVADDWHSHFSQWDVWKIAEKIIELNLTSWDPLPELQQRFLDALTWHGEAVSEPTAKGRLLKFWAAIERAVSTRVSADVTRRAALLHSRTPQEFDAKFLKCQKLYSIRSSLIHGGKTHNIQRLETDALKIEQVSRDVIITSSYLLQNLTNEGRASREGLEQEFTRLDSIVKQWRKRPH